MVSLEPGKYYHIYNRAIDGNTLFFNQENYHYFIQKYSIYLCDSVDTFAYCLLKNHFHFLIRIKDFSKSNGNFEDGLHSPERIVSKKFADLFNSYTKSINKSENRTGGLFETPFKRIEVRDDSYFTKLIGYIHNNPVKHGIVKNIEDYPYSSYLSYLSDKESKLCRDEVMNWFGGKDEFKKFHVSKLNEKEISDYKIEFE